MSTTPDTKESSVSVASRNADQAVYCEQVKLLYQQLPVAIIGSVLIAVLFTYVVWDENKPLLFIAWLSIVPLFSLANYFFSQRFKQRLNEATDFKKWECYYLAGTVVSALLWGYTSLWLDANTPLAQQVFQLVIILSLTGGAVATLSSRLLVFRAFILVILVPYIARLLYLGSPSYYSIASLSMVYIMLMFPVSRRVYSVITQSLYLRHENSELLESYRNADQVNKKANEALFEIMKKNKEEELKLEKSESFLRSILATANDGIITTDRHGFILTVNHAIERDFGYTQEEMVGKSINMIMEDNEMGRKHDEYMEQYFQDNMPILKGRMLDVKGRRKDGSVFPIEITVSETRVDDEVFFTGIMRDTSDRKMQEAAMHNMMLELARASQELEQANLHLHDKNKELTALSEHDALTGLPNRRFLLKTFDKEWPRHQRYNRPMAVILLDIDYFKRYNDKYGHQAGDECLQKIAAIFNQNIYRPADFIARYGGEEFIAVLPETDIEGAYHLAEKMRKAVIDLNITHEGSLVAKHVTVSGGVASVRPGKENDSEMLIKWADDALYMAKQNGRNRICRFDEHGTKDQLSQT